MVFECSCGFRPFLHNLQPVQWWVHVGVHVIDKAVFFRAGQHISLYWMCIFIYLVNSFDALTARLIVRTWGEDVTFHCCTVDRCATQAKPTIYCFKCERRKCALVAAGVLAPLANCVNCWLSSRHKFSRYHNAEAKMLSPRLLSCVHLHSFRSGMTDNSFGIQL